MSTQKKTPETISIKHSKQKEIVGNNTIQYPVNDDLLDDIDSQVDQFNETNNLGEKISIHRQLQQNLSKLKKEVDLMVDIIDKIDTETVSVAMNEDRDKNSTNSNINDDIVSIEKMIEDMKEEDVMQLKLKHYARIVQTVQECRAKCDSHKMTISKV